MSDRYHDENAVSNRFVGSRFLLASFIRLPISWRLPRNSLSSFFSYFFLFFWFFSIRDPADSRDPRRQERLALLISKCPRDALISRRRDVTWRRCTCLSRKKNNSIMPMPATLLSQWFPCLVRFFSPPARSFFALFPASTPFFPSRDRINLRLDCEVIIPD